MSNDNRIPECDYCGDDRGVCDRYPHLEDGRRFTIKLDETFDVCTVRNDDKSLFIIKHDFCFFTSTCNFLFYNSTSASPAMQDDMSWRSSFSKKWRIWRRGELT